MKNLLLTAFVRTRFCLNSRNGASQQIRRTSDQYLVLADQIDKQSGRRIVETPRMLGVDEDMRRWSFFMILEHNTIVNKVITKTVERLALDENSAQPLAVDPKHDVMPSFDAGAEQLVAFRESIEEYLKNLAVLPSLRGTARKRHPLFGDFDAHEWHCMLGLHLQIHLKQAIFVATHSDC